jgi:hypothetical protein
MKNPCFNLIISEKDLADFTFQGMRSYLGEKLEGHIYLWLMQLQQLLRFKKTKSRILKKL